MPNEHQGREKIMIEERAAELSAELRSGNRKQGRYLLCRVNADGTKEWCCLGVACDLAAQVSSVGIKATLSDNEYDGAGGPYRRMAWDGRDGLMPQSVRDYFGFKTDNGAGGPGILAPNGRLTESLASANDNGVTFTQIADYIDANWAKL